MPSPRTPDAVSHIEQSLKKDFEANRRILSFDEYLTVLADAPKAQLRNSSTYIADMMDHFGKTELSGATAEIEQSRWRFNLFDEPVDSGAAKIVRQESVQSQIYRSLRTFSRQGFNSRMILLHGPNGSAKSSILHALMGGMERYSRDSQEGAVYTFSWIFPLEKLTKQGIGINTYSGNKNSGTYAHLEDDEVGARLPCELRDHPILLIPTDRRREFLGKLIGEKLAQEIWSTLPAYFTTGEPCHRCKLVQDALLAAHEGELSRVLNHIQVERYFYSRRFRKGLVTIEPQMHVDAGYQQLTVNRSLSSLPASLQSISFFTVQGDLIDGNRGLIEYSDLLKRPVDSFKYLLSACETGAVNVGPTIVALDTVMLGSTNEVQLDAFKEYPDFPSFKARIDLVRTPYLLSVSAEKEIYEPHLSQFGGEKHVTPHVAWSVALWAVLSRLKKPNGSSYAPELSSLAGNLSPLEKAKLYDNGEVPGTLSPEDRKILRAGIAQIRDEYSLVPYYEGRMGASSRDVKSILFEAGLDANFPCLSPLSVLRQLEEFCKRSSEHDFLKQDVVDGYHDHMKFIEIARQEYLSRVDQEVRTSIGLYDTVQWEEFLRRYVQQISLALKKEKQKNPITGKMDDPDFSLIEEFEKIVAAPEGAAERETFRTGIISQIGAWSLDHVGKAVAYREVFPELWRRIERHYFESQKSLLMKMRDALQYDSDGAGNAPDSMSEGAKLAQQTVDAMKKRYHYCDLCAKEVITFLLTERY